MPDATDRKSRDAQPDLPALETQDWEELEGTELLPDGAAENGDFRPEQEADSELPEEDDDNPYQESDEALPDDPEERTISRNPAREGGRFDEV